jgi:hypothetical protein
LFSRLSRYQLYEKLDEAQGVAQPFFSALLKRYIDCDLREGALHVFRCCVRRHLQVCLEARVFACVARRVSFVVLCVHVFPSQTPLQC